MGEKRDDQPSGVPRDSKMPQTPYETIAIAEQTLEHFRSKVASLEAEIANLRRENGRIADLRDRWERNAIAQAKRVGELEGGGCIANKNPPAYMPPTFQIQFFPTLQRIEVDDPDGGRYDEFVYDGSFNEQFWVYLRAAVTKFIDREDAHTRIDARTPQEATQTMDDKCAKFVSKYCTGERCRICHLPAAHKVEEVIFDDDPTYAVEVSPGIRAPGRHPYVAYLCDAHFRHVMGLPGERGTG